MNSTPSTRRLLVSWSQLVRAVTLLMTVIVSAELTARVEDRIRLQVPLLGEPGRGHGKTQLFAVVDELVCRTSRLC